jgi:hypothetical protein
VLIVVIAFNRGHGAMYDRGYSDGFDAGASLTPGSVHPGRYCADLIDILKIGARNGTEDFVGSDYSAGGQRDYKQGCVAGFQRGAEG